MPLFWALLHVLVGSTSFAVTVLVSLALFYTKRIIQMVSFRLMLQLNLAFLFNTLSHVLVGVNLLIGENYHFKQINGALRNFAMFAILTFMFLLAAERLNITVLKCKFNFRGRKLLVVSVVTWSFAAIFFGILVSPLTLFYFDVDKGSWIYGHDFRSNFVNTIDTIATLGLVPATFILYVAIFVHLAKKRTFATSAGRRVFTPELKMLIASTLTFLYQFLNNVLYEINDELDFDNFWYNLCVHINAICLPFFCQLMLLVFNRSIRRNLLKLVLRRKSSSVVFAIDPRRNSLNSNTTKTTTGTGHSLPCQ